MCALTKHALVLNTVGHLASGPAETGLGLLIRAPAVIAGRVAVLVQKANLF